MSAHQITSECIGLTGLIGFWILIINRFYLFTSKKFILLRAKKIINI